MKRLVAMVVAAGAAVAAVAMPTRAELQKAQAMVNDVTAVDVKALKAKTKTPAEVAAKHMELAGQAGNEAEKYILLQGAFKLYAKAGDYEGAANALGTMNREIADMNPEVIVEIYNKAIFSSMKAKAPKLHAIKEAARRQVFYRKQLAKAEAAVKANPKDPAAQKKLGECHAELGNWSKALDAFVLAGGNLAKTATAEKDGTAAPQVSGDFWWDYENGDEISTYKLHAAELYRAALADDSFKGLARTRTEQRVQDAEKVAVGLPPVVSVPETVVSGKALTPKCKMVNGRPAPLKFELAKGVELELEGCPAGAFTMGYKKCDWRPVKNAAPLHNVRITRPFWIGKFQLTRGQFKQMGFDLMEDEEFRKGFNAMDGKDGLTCAALITYHMAQEFLSKLNSKFIANLPKGYTFRLPTDAEWEYASKASDYSETNVVMKYADRPPYYAVFGLMDDDRVALMKKGGVDWTKRWAVPPGPVGLKKANAWGIYDMVGNTDEMLLDRVSLTDSQTIRYSEKYKGVIVELKCIEDDDDPLLLCDDGSGILVRGVTLLKVGRPRDAKLTFRVCLGPDLVAEKKAKGNSDADAKKTEVAGPDACYPREDFGGELLSSKYEIVEKTGNIRYVRHMDGLFNCERPNRSAGDGFAFEVGAKEKEAGFTLKLSEPIALAGLLIVNRAEVCKERQVPLCVWASEDRVKWERVFIDESVRDEYRIDLSNKNITCKYLRFGRLPGVNNEPFHLARTLVYAKKVGVGEKANQPEKENKTIQTLPPVKPLGARPADKKFNLAKGIDIEMIGCPAGEFIMGESSRSQEFFPHNVKISRPFWLSKTRVTFEQYETFKKTGAKEKELEKWAVTEALGGRQCPVWGITYEEFLRFCEVLTRKHQGKIPKGYVFRPPTEAEWEYAYRTDTTDENDPYCWQTRDQKLDQLPLFRPKKVQELADAKVKAMGIDVFKIPDYRFPSPKVGTQPPNKWGVCDLLDFGLELTLDTIDRSKNVNSQGGWHWHLVNPNNQVFHYELSETDPLKVFESKGGADAVTRLGMLRKFESVARWFVCRLCLGPDLIAEKKAKGK